MVRGLGLSGGKLDSRYIMFDFKYVVTELASNGRSPRWLSFSWSPDRSTRRGMWSQPCFRYPWQATELTQTVSSACSTSGYSRYILSTASFLRFVRLVSTFLQSFCHAFVFYKNHDRIREIRLVFVQLLKMNLPHLNSWFFCSGCGGLVSLSKLMLIKLYVLYHVAQKVYCNLKLFKNLSKLYETTQ